MPYSIVAIGTSWGGLTAMSRLLGSLSGDFPLPIVVVQHRSKDSDRLLAQLLQDATDLEVCEVDDKDLLEAGKVHVAPADYHVMVERGYLSLTIEAPVRYSRPSIDVMFVQSPKTAEIPTMPDAALRAVPGAEALALPEIAKRLIELSQQTTGALAMRRAGS